MAETKEVKKRNLDDLSKTASMDMVAVNNLIVSLRAPVKKSRVRVIHQLTKKARQLKSKKGGEDQTKKNAEKAERLLQEAQAMNGLDVDKVAKFALSNTVTFDQLVQNQPDAPMTTRAMTRLASYKDLSDRVKQFRQDHDDWRELANFILYKNTGRRYRKNKTKRKEGEAVIRDMVVKNLGGDEKKVEKDDGDGNESEDENESEDSEGGSGNGDSENESDGKESDGNESDDNIQKDAFNIQNESDSNDEDGDSDDNQISDKNVKKLTQKSNDTKQVSSKSTMANKLKSLVADLPSDSSNDEEEKSFAPDRLAKRLLGIPDSNASSSTSSDKNDSSSKNDDDGSSDSEPAKPKIQGEMVVAKLNMNDDIDKTFAKIQSSTFGDKWTKHKPKSSFFLGGESDSEPEEDDADVDAQIKSEKDLSEEQTNRGREMVESIFVADLSGKGGYSGGRGRGVPRGRGAPAWRGGPPGRGGRGGPPGRGGHRGRGEPVQAFGRGRGGDRGGHQRGHGMFGHRGAGRSHGFEPQQGTPGKAPEKDSGPLHPSWEASRKRKEASSIQAFTGKKIKFDDD